MADIWVIGLSEPLVPKQGTENSEDHIWVQELLIQEGKQWNVPLVRHLFEAETASLILHMRISIAAEDKRSSGILQEIEFSLLNLRITNIMILVWEIWKFH